MRALGTVVLILLVISVNASATPVALHSMVLPEPGLLVLLGSGLVGLANLVRRHLGQ